MRFAILYLGLIMGCVSHPEKSAPATRKAQIEDKILEASAALNALSDPETGWPSKTDCDGTLWAGLACAGGYPVKIELAEYFPGEVHRRPPPSCWNRTDGDVGAKSTTSNDMLLGYMWCLWSRRDAAGFKRLADYGEAHSWVMGEPTAVASRVVLKPNQLAILGRALHKLGDDRGYRNTPALYGPAVTDSEQHLQALGITLYGEVTEGNSMELVDINGNMLERLQALADADPKNPGFVTALGIYTGDMEGAVDLFLDSATPIPSYVRGNNVAAFAWAERLFWLTKAHARMED